MLTPIAAAKVAPTRVAGKVQLRINAALA